MSEAGNIKSFIKAIVPELDNTSSSSIVGRIISTVESLLGVVELEISNSEQTVENAARTLKVMGKQFYIEKSLAFQYGSALTVIDSQTGTYGYDPVDTSKQIIKQVAISTNENGQILLKVAKTNEEGYIVQLSNSELQSFDDYMDTFTPLGMQMQPASSPPAVLNCSSLYIRYSKEYSFSVIQEELPKIFISFQTQLRGDDPVYVNDIEAAIKSIDGVRDAYFNGLKAVENESEITPENGVLVIPAGYFNFAEDLINLTNLNPGSATGTNDIFTEAV